MQFNTETLSEHDIALLAEKMADNPEFAKKLVAAISEKLDEKFGFQQGQILAKLEEIDGRFDHIDMRFDRVDKRFDTLERNMKMSSQRQDFFDRRLSKIEDRQ